MFLIEEFIETELKKKRYRERMKRLEYQFHTDRPYLAWWGGRVDPRLIGGFAIIHATMVNRKSEAFDQNLGTLQNQCCPIMFYPCSLSFYGSAGSI